MRSYRLTLRVLKYWRAPLPLLMPSSSCSASYIIFAQGVRLQDQNTQNAVLISVRIGYQVAQHSLNNLMEWNVVDEVRSCAVAAADTNSKRASSMAAGPLDTQSLFAPLPMLMGPSAD